MPGHRGSGWRTVPVGGRPVSYLDVGDGPVVLFLHGWGLSYDSYRPALARLAGLGLRVLAPALPGFGGTADLPDSSFSFEGYAAWAADFLEAVAIDSPVTLVGHSFGGGVAIQAAHDFPERVGRLVLVNSVGGSAWTRGSLLKRWTARPPWDWGLHLGADPRGPGAGRRARAQRHAQPAGRVADRRAGPEGLAHC
jgi:pimeloyl-ACP methyl ester carboxylesterase